MFPATIQPEEGFISKQAWINFLKKINLQFFSKSD